MPGAPLSAIRHAASRAPLPLRTAGPVAVTARDDPGLAPAGI